MSEIDPPGILIIDDHKVSLEMLGLILKDEGAALVKVESALQALEELKLRSFALILCDVKMPEMDGYEFAGILKNDLKMSSIPIIFITSVDKKQIEYIKLISLFLDFGDSA